MPLPISRNLNPLRHWVSYLRLVRLFRRERFDLVHVHTPIAALLGRLAARRAGVWFDVANGRTGHLRWDTFDRIIQAGFWPDTISTDGSTTSPTAESVIDFPNVLSKFLNFGMTLDQVVARATLNASRIFPLFRDRGTLNVGAPADVVAELWEQLVEASIAYEMAEFDRTRG